VCTEIVEEDRHRGVARAVGVLLDGDRPVFGQRPYRLSAVGEGRRLAEQPLVPRSGSLQVPHVRAAKRCSDIVASLGRAAAGTVSLQRLQRWMGHHSPAFTLETYGHLIEGNLGPALDLRKELASPRRT
jgi:hypothetical protein